MKALVAESQWAKGIIVLNGHQLQGERRSFFGQYEYRINGQTLKAVDSFLQTEFMDWRDG